MQKNYGAFDTEQFLGDPFFVEWVRVGSPEAEAFWTEWVRSAPSNLKAMRDAEAQLKMILSVRRIQPQPQDAGEVWQGIQQSLENGKDGHSGLHAFQSRKVAVRYFRWVAAAAVIALMLTVTGLWITKNGRDKKTAVKEERKTDILPGHNGAILTLADGSTTVLDNAQDGRITDVAVKNGNTVVYGQTHSTKVEYNTMTTPKGRQFSLVLPDGTQVWLNAASSITYPTAFVGNERKVSITGEAYFEVAHNASAPFHVDVNEIDVQVLGTHFNVNSYADEPSVKTTLLEGRVTVKRNGKLVYLNPGQAAVVRPAQDDITVDFDVDADEVLAWKNGLFVFNNTPLDNVMRQIERWYNVDVVYQGSVPRDKFNGSIARNTNLSEVLKVLEYSDIRFRVEGSTITVLPQ